MSVWFSVFEGEIIPKTQGFGKNTHSWVRPRIAIYSSRTVEYAIISRWLVINGRMST
jgi:hypothetical protein